MAERSVAGAVVLTLAGLVGPSLSGCSEYKPEPRPSAEVRLSKVVDHGNGVYEFPADERFGNTLSEWRKAHPDLKIVSVTQGPDEVRDTGHGRYGQAPSMFVVTEGR